MIKFEEPPILHTTHTDTPHPPAPRRPSIVIDTPMVGFDRYTHTPILKIHAELLLFTESRPELRDVANGCSVGAIFKQGVNKVKSRVMMRIVTSLSLIL